MSIDITPTTILGPSEGIGEHQAVSIVRNTKGSAWNPVGNNELIGSGRFRYNYNPVTGVPEGRVLMGSWTNEILDPRDMTTGNWSGAATVARDQVGIDGQSNTACTLTDDDTGTFEPRYQDVTIADNSNTHTVSVYIKKDQDETRFPEVTLQYRGGTNVASDVQINTKTGNVVFRNQGSGATAESVDKGDFWELRVSQPNNTSGNTVLRLSLRPAITTTIGTFEASATGSAIFDVAGVFLNRSTPPPVPVYGETAGSTFTQNADDVDVSTLSDINLNADDNMFEVEFKTGKDSGVLFDLHTDGNNRMYAERNASNEIHFIVIDGGTTQADLNLGTVADDTEGKIVVGWKKNDIAGCLDGGTVKTDTSAAIPSVTDLHIGRDYNGANYLNGGLIRHLTYPRKEDSTTIQDLSK